MKSDDPTSEARTQLMFARPYLSKGLLAMKVVVTEDTPALAVDRYWRLYANPGWLRTHSVGVAATGFYHELEHLLLDHHGRAEAVGVTAATMHVWNGEAADPDINDGLCVDCVSCRPVLPLLPEEWCSLPKHFGMPDGRTAEWYFHERMKQQREMRGGGSGDDPEDGGSGNGGRGRSGHGSGSGRGEREELDYGCGSGASGVAAPWDVGSPEESGVDGLEDADARDVRRQVAMDIKAHAEQKGRGSVPGSLLEWADELTRPRAISWDHLLASAVRRAAHSTAGSVQHSYARPSRRQHAYGQVIMPSFRRPIPNVAIVTDTSRSMSQRWALVRGVVDDACRRLSVPLRVIDVDVEVQRDSLVSTGRRAAQAGGGGTDMRVGIEHAMKRPRPADSIVVVTDCETPWPNRRPNAHVIVAAVGATRAHLAAVPPWATVIEVEVSR